MGVTQEVKHLTDPEEMYQLRMQLSSQIKSLEEVRRGVLAGVGGSPETVRSDSKSARSNPLKDPREITARR
jgi:hypothetical protein